MLVSGLPSLEQSCLPSLLAQGLELRPGKTCLVSAEGTWTNQNLDHASTRYAAGLLSLGLKPGDRVASLMPNCAALMIHYLACFKAGLVATPLNYRYTPSEIDHALKVSGANAILAHVSRDDDLARSLLVGELQHGIIRYGARDIGGRTFEELLESGAASKPSPKRDPHEPAMIFFTSGSTGPAKGVTHSFESLGWMVSCLVAAYALTADDTILSVASLSHIGAFLDDMAGLVTGAGIILPRSTEANEVLPLLRQCWPTILVSLPASLFELIQLAGAEQEDFASVRLCTAGGDKVPIELAREFKSVTGLEIVEQYGMSEIGIATINPVSGENKIGSVGCPIAGYELSIRGVSGTQLPHDEEGRLWVKSPCNMLGYWSDHLATAATIKDGWLDTGDVMKVDADGYFWFCGRQKQIIVHDGSNISPQEVEDALLRHPAVALAGVVGVKNLVHGENVCAFVTLKQVAVLPSGIELIEFARARVGYKAPEDVFFLDQMPINAVGKVDREKLKSLANKSPQPHGGNLA